jgi:hypothetical protein
LYSDTFISPLNSFYFLILHLQGDNTVLFALKNPPTDRFTICSFGCHVSLHTQQNSSLNLIQFGCKHYGLSSVLLLQSSQGQLQSSLTYPKLDESMFSFFAQAVTCSHEAGE